MRIENNYNVLTYQGNMASPTLYAKPTSQPFKVLEVKDNRLYDLSGLALMNLG